MYKLYCIFALQLMMKPNWPNRNLRGFSNAHHSCISQQMYKIQKNMKIGVMLKYHIAQYQHQLYHAHFSLQDLTAKKYLRANFGLDMCVGPEWDFLQSWWLIHVIPIPNKIRPEKPVDFTGGWVAFLIRLLTKALVSDFCHRMTIVCLHRLK